MLRHFIVALTLATGLAGTATGVAQTQNQTPAATATAPVRNDYGKSESWLCRPGGHDACTVDLTTTIVASSGKLSREKWAANPKAPIDCFYVYPTVSNDSTGNSDMVAGPEELNVIRVQFARFGSQCRVYAPLYRQVTLSALRAFMTGRPTTAHRALTYNDVLDAWNYYLEHDNHGRGVVLIGHSQGSMVLTQLIKNEIDGKPLQSRIISALLLGTSLPVPRGKDIGGAFQHMPLCHSAKQTGCVITYASFRSNAPPPANSRFGRVAGEGMVSGCTNPAALAGGSGTLHAYLGSRRSGIVSNEAEPRPWVTPTQSIDTPFVSLPGLLTAECISNEKGSYLAITVHGEPSDPRTDEIAGDVVVNGIVLGDWGLHLIDVNLAIGNLVDIVGQQSKAYLAANKIAKTAAR
jgi:pimeloyl-ACP methyl ester carboxylesterase